MSVRMKIMLSFLVMTLFMAIQAAVGFQQNNYSRELVDRSIHKNYRVIQDLNQLSNKLGQLRRYEKEYFIYIPDFGKKQKYVAEWRDTLRQIEALVKTIRENGDGRYSKEDMASFVAWSGAITFYAAEFEKIVTRFAKPNDLAKPEDGVEFHPAVEANDLIQEGKTRVSVVVRESEKMIAARSEEAVANARSIEANFDQMESISVALTVGAILISVLMLLGIYRTLIQTLGTLLRESQRIYSGNLSAPVALISVPELRTLANALEQMRLDRIAVAQRKSQQAA